MTDRAGSPFVADGDANLEISQEGRQELPPVTTQTATKTPSKRKPATIPVNERNLREAAKRLLSNRQIVSTEIHYIQRTMGARATRTEIDETVVAVRGLTWAQLVADE